MADNYKSYVVENTEKKLLERGKNFKVSFSFENGSFNSNFCSVCKGCCWGDEESDRTLLGFDHKLTDQEYREAKQYLDLQDRYNAYFEDKECKGLGKNGCQVKEKLKPLTCKLYPFYLDSEMFLYLDLYCPLTSLVRPIDIYPVAHKVIRYLERFPKNIVRNLIDNREGIYMGCWLE